MPRIYPEATALYEYAGPTPDYSPSQRAMAHLWSKSGEGEKEPQRRVIGSRLAFRALAGESRLPLKENSGTSPKFGSWRTVAESSYERKPVLLALPCVPG